MFVLGEGGRSNIHITLKKDIDLRVHKYNL